MTPSLVEQGVPPRQKEKQERCTTSWKVFFGLLGGVLGVTCVMLLVFLPANPSENEYQFLSFGSSPVHPEVFKKAAIATDADPCASIARDTLLLENATTMDAAIAGLLCNGVVNVHSMGIGGGFFMLIYNESSGIAYAIDARETAPAAATKDMFQGNASLSVLGGLAIAVPGELHGYHLAHERFGGIEWRELFQPTITLLRSGVPVRKALADNLQGEAATVLADPVLKAIFTDSSGELLKEGDNYTNEALAKTFETVAEEGYATFYNGSVARKFLKDLRNRSSIITEADLQNYRAKWVENPIRVELGDYVLYSLPPPSSGSLLAYMLNVMAEYDPSSVDSIEEEKLMWHRFVETMKWAYAKRTLLGDPFDEAIRENVTKLVADLISDETAAETKGKISDETTSTNPLDYEADFQIPRDDHGTAQFCIAGPDGLSISVTSTINLVLGSQVMSSSTGILFNDQMDDFSSPNVTNDFGIPPSPTNFILPGKRPLSSMAPAIFVDRNTNETLLVIGSSGGPRITSAIAYAALRFLWLGQGVKVSVDSARLHHQLLPMEIRAQDDVPESVRQYLLTKGHTFRTRSYGPSSVVAIGKGPDGNFHAIYDYRKPGEVAGLN